MNEFLSQNGICTERSAFGKFHRTPSLKGRSTVYQDDYKHKISKQYWYSSTKNLVCFFNKELGINYKFLDSNPQQHSNDWSIEALEKKYAIVELLAEVDDITNSKISASKAITFLTNIGDRANRLNKDLEYPTMHPSDDDSIDLLWNGDTSLLINFSAILGSYGFFGKSETKGTIKGKSPIDCIRYDLLAWLTDNDVH